MSLIRPWLMFGITAMPLLAVAPASAFENWPQATPEAVGLAPDVGDRVDAAFERGDVPNLHSVLVVRRGKLAVERYYEGPDQHRGRGRVGIVDFGPDDLHDLRSVTKSVVSLLYGIALADGAVPGLETPLLDAFPEHDDLAADEDRQRMTVHHTLTMTLGLEWNEDLPYTDPRNSETAMDRASDKVRYVLEQAFVSAPGETWEYNGGATAVLGALIRRGTGRSLLDFAHERLFGPLGISDVEWITDHRGHAIAASGMRLRPRDLARIGQLILNGGTWPGPDGDVQVVPARWIAAATSSQVTIDADIGYGFQSWIGRTPIGGERWIAGFGNGGQRLFVSPGADLVVVITAGNYNNWPKSQLSSQLIRTVILPAVEQAH